MALSAIERLDLSDELDELLEKAGTAKGLDLLDLNDQIDDVLVKLGYGAADAPAPTPPPPADPKDDGAPEIVTKFLAGDFSKQPDTDFVSTLNALEPFVGVFLTLDDVKAGAVTWIKQRPLQAA